MLIAAVLHKNIELIGIELIEWLTHKCISRFITGSAFLHLLNEWFNDKTIFEVTCR